MIRTIGLGRMPRRLRSFLDSASILCFLFLAFGQMAAQARSQFKPFMIPGTRINLNKVQKMSISSLDSTDLRTYEDLSSYLYGGDRSYANILRKLNPSLNFQSRSLWVSYPAPQVKVAYGKTFQEIGAFWAGGSARSFFTLLPLNPQIKSPDLLFVGSWINLPRLPNSQERKEWRSAWFRNNTAYCSYDGPRSGNHRAPASLVPVQTTPSIYAPRSPQEKLDFVEWYVSKEGSERSRSDLLVKDLLNSPPPGWRAPFVAGQYYFKTGRYTEASKAFSISLKDDQAPIQVALFLMRSTEKAHQPLSASEKKGVFSRFPSLEKLMSEGDSSDDE